STLPRSLLIFVPAFFLILFNDTATSDLYTLSLHDALPISSRFKVPLVSRIVPALDQLPVNSKVPPFLASTTPRLVTSCAKMSIRSAEHTSELQSRRDLVCRLVREQQFSA